jgi:hypothetical protein
MTIHDFENYFICLVIFIVFYFCLDSLMSSHTTFSIKINQLPIIKPFNYTINTSPQIETIRIQFSQEKKNENRL